MSTSTRRRSPVKAKPPRAVHVEVPAAPDDPDCWSAVCITVGKETALYLVRLLDADFGIGYELEKLDPDTLVAVEVYHVSLASDESSCTCPGHCYHGRCKHVDGLKALDGAGRLPKPRMKQKHAACPRCCERVDGGGLCGRCIEDEREFAAYHQADEMGFDETIFDSV